MLNLVLLSLFACVEKENEETDVLESDSSTENKLDCADGVCTLTGTITEDLTLTSDNVYLLRGGVFIGDDVEETVLTIEPGTRIYGESSTDGMLVIRRGSKINAEGTADAPIVFSSSKAVGSRARGDWGGLIINGRAPINSCSGGSEEICEAFGEGGTGFYGGDDTEDSSGILKYVRVEFAGTLVSPENELNGIAFQGVGSETEVDFVQVHMNADDGIEFFGGNVVVKHALITGAGDDSMDWTDGWQGGAQYVIIHQHEDNGDNGIEADNNGESNDATPRSNPTLANFTIIGSPESERSDIGVLLREGTAADLINFAVLGFNDACLNVDNDATIAQLEEGSILMTNSVLNCAVNFAGDYDLETWFLGQEGNAIGEAELTAVFDVSTPDYTPVTMGSATAGDASILHSSFDSADFIGAVDAVDWTLSWTTHERN